MGYNCVREPNKCQQNAMIIVDGHDQESYQYNPVKLVIFISTNFSNSPASEFYQRGED